jgi:hypothetical protein
MALEGQSRTKAQANCLSLKFVFYVCWSNMAYGCDSQTNCVLAWHTDKSETEDINVCCVVLSLDGFRTYKKSDLRCYSDSVCECVCVFIHTGIDKCWFSSAGTKILRASHFSTIETEPAQASVFALHPPADSHMTCRKYKWYKYCQLCWLYNVYTG